MPQVVEDEDAEVGEWRCQRSLDDLVATNQIFLDRIRSGGEFFTEILLGNVTLPETNIAPENKPLERRFLLETIIFRGHLSFRECNR